MGLNIDAARFLISEKRRGAEFGKTITLGRQAIYIPRDQYSDILAELNEKLTDESYAGDFFRGLGANPLTTMDFSDYEGAEIIHDANEPISSEFHGTYDTVIDGGTLEHVFNFPTAISNCMNLVKLGGRVILLTPWHNFSGHGFYEFSPELLWNVFSEKNGFEVERMRFVADESWFAVKNPAEIKHRIEIRSNSEVLLFVTARKIAEKPLFQEWPQQSDYAATWLAANAEAPSAYVEPGFKKLLLKKIPALRSLQRQWKTHRRNKMLKPRNHSGFTYLCPADQFPPP